MNRLLFEKTGNGIWISHLDLMRLFQRAFKRGGLNLKHSQGFSPRAMVSIALPLSVGVESVCEILDYELDGQSVPHEEVVERLNATMPAGVRVLKSYESICKVKNLAKQRCGITLEYDNGVPEGAVEEIKALFHRESLSVEKKGKNGPVEQDIIPMISNLAVTQPDENTVKLGAVVCAQNPSLNPQLLVSAIGRYVPELNPDFAKIRREEVLLSDGGVFR